jgi:uracil-DNA glycosylase
MCGKIMIDRKVLKQQLLDALYAPYKNCTLCPLGTAGRTNTVFGRGNPDANLLLLGEGPGKDEDQQGAPFVGRSGKLLSKTLGSLGIEEESIYITNIVKCRPPNNRAPLPNEVSTCTQLFLENQIKIIRPHIICTLGTSALKSLIDTPLGITKTRGVSQPYKGIYLLPTYHPAYVLRNRKQLPFFSQDIQTAHLKSKAQTEF